LLWMGLAAAEVAQAPFMGVTDTISPMARKLLLQRGRIGGFHDGVLYPYGTKNMSPFSAVPGSRLFVRDDKAARLLLGPDDPHLNKTVLAGGTVTYTAKPWAGLAPPFMPPKNFGLPEEVAQPLTDTPSSPKPKTLEEEGVVSAAGGNKVNLEDLSDQDKQNTPKGEKAATTSAATGRPISRYPYMYAGLIDPVANTTYPRNPELDIPKGASSSSLTGSLKKMIG